VIELDLGRAVKTVTFDETGRMVRSSLADQWTELSTADEVVKRFPSARRYLSATTAPAEPETSPATREADDEGRTPPGVEEEGGSDGEGF
jgi:hypothetical protein